MTEADRKIIFTALAFAVVILQGGSGDDSAERARTLAKLMEEFCKSTVTGNS